MFRPTFDVTALGTFSSAACLKWDDRDAALQALSDDSSGQTFAKPLPVMDGGVADNQGFGSLRVALEALRARLLAIWQSLEAEVRQFPVESIGPTGIESPSAL